MWVYAATEQLNLNDPVTQSRLSAAQWHRRQQAQQATHQHTDSQQPFRRRQDQYPAHETSSSDLGDVDPPSTESAPQQETVRRVVLQTSEASATVQEQHLPLMTSKAEASKEKDMTKDTLIAAGAKQQPCMQGSHASCDQQLSGSTKHRPASAVKAQVKQVSEELQSLLQVCTPCRAVMFAKRSHIMYKCIVVL